jgi:hypothetical protein
VRIGDGWRRKILGLVIFSGLSSNGQISNIIDQVLVASSSMFLSTWRGIPPVSPHTSLMAPALAAAPPPSPCRLALITPSPLVSAPGMPPVNSRNIVATLHIEHRYRYIYSKTSRTPPKRNITNTGTIFPNQNAQTN